jgi:cytosine permease
MLTFKVKEQDRQGWGDTALITAGQLLCIPALMIGGILGEGLSLGVVAFCTLTGTLVLLACACFMGARSSKSGLPSTVLSAGGLGVRGARFVPALLITITGVGWFGVQAAACGASFSVMAAEALGVSVPAWAATLFWGLVIGIFAIQGYRVLRHFYYITVPVISVVVVYTVIHTVSLSEAGSALFAWRPAEPLPYVTGVTLVVGTWAMGAYAVGDYCRYAKTPRDAVLGSSVGIIAIPAMLLIGAIFRIVTGNADITAILSGMGYPAVALVFLILSTWAINVINAYQGGIALSVLLGFEEKRLKLGTALTAGIGTVLGATGILSWFTNFLSLLSSFVPPLIGVLAGVKIARLLGYGTTGGNPVIPRNPIEGAGVKPAFHIPGLIAYGLGALTAWITSGALPFFIPPLNGILTSALVYVILEKLFPVER